MVRKSSSFVVALLLFLFGLSLFAQAEALLVPMDDIQKNHLKAYGLTYWALQTPRRFQAEWLLNYRGGSFLIREVNQSSQRAAMMGVSCQVIGDSEIAAIYQIIERENMERILLEKAPKVAVYTPPDKEPWDDAVTLALTYAEIPYETLWDTEVLLGRLPNYDWLHLHHEDFTGQYGKFFRYRNAAWYKQQVTSYEEAARAAGFNSVQEHKAAVTARIVEYVAQGGFLFAMCAATDSLDIARAAVGLDIVAPEFDGDGLTPGFQDKLDFTKTLAFQNFQLVPDPNVYEFSDIDTSNAPVTPGSRYVADDFALFEFSAKFDPVPTMLTQDHTARVHDFLGQTSAFRKEKIKPNITILGEFPGQNIAKYLHGVYGQGTFSFLAGHDPEDREHLVGEKATDLSQYPNSPGYRLILNNILFPAAKKKERKT
ncbi:MAG: asparagine synthetase B [bacterium]